MTINSQEDVLEGIIHSATDAYHTQVLAAYDTYCAETGGDHDLPYWVVETTNRRELEKMGIKFPLPASLDERYAKVIMDALIGQERLEGYLLNADDAIKVSLKNHDPQGSNMKVYELESYERVFSDLRACGNGTDTDKNREVFEQIAKDTHRDHARAVLIKTLNENGITMDPHKPSDVLGWRTYTQDQIHRLCQELNETIDPKFPEVRDTKWLDWDLQRDDQGTER